jgi:hypothetical protein
MFCFWQESGRKQASASSLSTSERIQDANLSKRKTLAPSARKTTSDKLLSFRLSFSLNTVFPLNKRGFSFDVCQNAVLQRRGVTLA